MTAAAEATRSLDDAILRLAVLETVLTWETTIDETTQQGLGLIVAEIVEDIDQARKEIERAERAESKAAAE